MKLRLGTRGSALAVVQSKAVAQALCQATGCEVELVTITSKADAIPDKPLAEIGGKGLFTKEIEDALLDGTVDVAVHSMKDLPGEAPSGLIVPCIPEREDPRDVVVGKPLEELPEGAVVGTGSLRRAYQVQAIRPDLEVRGIRGNVGTRIRKQREGDYDAVVLAAAGMTRLERSDEIDAYLDVDRFIPAVGQGALAVQCREADTEICRLLEQIHHGPTAVCVAAERGFLIELSGGCSVPAGCHARWQGGRIEVRAFYGRPSGLRHATASGAPDQAEAMGRHVARRVF